MIKEGWSANFVGSFAFQWVRKLRKCIKLLLDWSRECFPNNRKKIDEVRRKTAEIQNIDMRSEGYEEVQNLTKELKEVWGR